LREREQYFEVSLEIFGREEGRRRLAYLLPDLKRVRALLP
jgi:hypothetical protein